MEQGGMIFSHWMTMSFETEKSSISMLERKSGVFIIKLLEKGREEVLHIGSGSGKGGLRERVRQIFHPGRTQITNKKIYAHLKAGHPLELCYCYCADPKGYVQALKKKAII